MSFLSPPSLFARRGVPLAALVLTLVAPAVLRCAEPLYSGPQKAGVLEAPPRRETSGLAASRRSPNILWTHDDSGGAPVLYAIDTSGKKRGALRVKGVKNEDWEDIAAFERDGKAWLLIGDIGDNDAERKTVRLHIVPEPPAEQLNPAGELEAAPLYTLRVRYEDGPRDCESIAVDAAEGAIYLLSKRDDPPRLYRVPLANSGEKIVEARLVGPVPTIMGSTQLDGLIKRLIGRKYSWPTGMDFAPDGRAAVVLTYGEPLVFARRADEPWPEAFQRPPTRLLFHGLPQAEGVCFAADSRSIYVVSEGSTTLVRYDREDP